MNENTKVCFFFFPQEIFYNTKNDRLFPIYALVKINLQKNNKETKI